MSIGSDSRVGGYVGEGSVCVCVCEWGEEECVGVCGCVRYISSMTNVVIPQAHTQAKRFLYRV